MSKRSVTKIPQSTLLFKFNGLLIFADTVYMIVKTLKRSWRHLAFGHWQPCWGLEVESPGGWNWWAVWVSLAENYGLHSSNTLGCFLVWPILHTHSAGEVCNIVVFASLGNQDGNMGPLSNNFTKYNLYSNTSGACSSFGWGYLRPRVPAQ